MTTSRHFDDPNLVDTYLDRAPRTVPAYHDIHRMTGVLIAERTTSEAKILVLGAGGGLEMKALAQAHSGWGFDAVDPSVSMLDLAMTTMGTNAFRVRGHHGFIDDAPLGPFDAATSLLTLHFLEADERRRTAQEVRRRLTPGAPFVVVHLSFPQRDAAERNLWFERHFASLIAAGVDSGVVEAMRIAMPSEVPVLSPEDDMRILQDAGFTGVTQFFAAFTFRGWVGYA